MISRLAVRALGALLGAIVGALGVLAVLALYEVPLLPVALLGALS